MGKQPKNKYPLEKQLQPASSLPSTKFCMLVIPCFAQDLTPAEIQIVLNLTGNPGPQVYQTKSVQSKRNMMIEPCNLYCYSLEEFDGIRTQEARKKERKNE